MINQAYPSVNDIPPSWADISITLAVDGGPLIEMVDIAAIKFSSKVELGKKRGASGGRIMGRTTGEGDQEASATLYRSGARQLVRGLKLAAEIQGFVRGNQVIISGVAFDVLILHTPPGEIEIYQALLKGCRYTGRDFDFKEGPDPDKVEIQLNPLEVVELIDGVEVVLL